MTATAYFLREQLRAPLTVALLVSLPFLFVLLAADVLSEFADVLGGSLAGDAASALGAGWSAAFITGALAFFATVSSRDADRRLALAGMGPARIAASRLSSSVILALLAAGAGYVALELTAGIAHPWHAAVAIAGFALIYLGVGAVVGSLIASPLEGSLAVSFVFILDAFSGPGMTEGGGSPLSVSRSAAEVLIDAAVRDETPAVDWWELLAWSAGAIAIAIAVFVLSARSRL